MRRNLAPFGDAVVLRLVGILLVPRLGRQVTSHSERLVTRPQILTRPQFLHILVLVQLHHLLLDLHRVNFLLEFLVDVGVVQTLALFILLPNLRLTGAHFLLNWLLTLVLHVWSLIKLVAAIIDQDVVLLAALA